MKLLLYADPHFSQTSSILIGHKNELSGRLESLIDSFKWISEVYINEVAFEHPICLGDLTDKPILTSEELTAIDKCYIQNHWSLVGNHCRSDKEGNINSISALVAKSFNKPEIIKIRNRKILFLPYNSEPYNLDEFGKVDIILSHNDLKGYDFGAGHLSSAGYDIKDILDHCELFINGHLHNGGWLVKDRIVNLGTMCGMNFSSCGGEWGPSIGILDLETLHLEIRENPYALRFKKFECQSLPKLKTYLDNLPNLSTYVLQIKVPSSISVECRKLIDQCPKVITCRIISQQDTIVKQKLSEETSLNKEIQHKSIYEKLEEYISKQSNIKCNKEVLNTIINEIKLRSAQ